MKLPKPSYNLCLDQVTIYLHLAQKSTNDQDRDRYLVAVARWTRKAREALETK